MNPSQCTHPHEHQRVGISHPLREIDHECELCGHVETQTLGVVDRKLPIVELTMALERSRRAYKAELQMPLSP